MDEILSTTILKLRAIAEEVTREDIAPKSRQVEKTGLPLLVCAEIDTALEELKKQDIAGARLVLVLFGPNLESPLAVARRLRREAPLAHFAFLTNGTNNTLTQQLKSPVAMVGSYWSIVNIASANLTAHLQEAVNSARQRLQLRTTLNRINLQLSSLSRADISELQRYRVSDRFLADILEHAQDAIIATNNDGVIITWNNAAQNMFGLSQDDAVGRLINEVAGGEWPEQLRHFMVQIRASETAYSRQELVCRRSDGRTLNIELMLSVVRQESGRPIGMSAVVRDITERKNLEKQLQQTQKLESLGVLAGGIAHDFNNILTGILGNAELALLELSPASSVREYLENTRKATIRAADLCKHMLAYSGKGRFLIQVLDLSQLIEEMTHLLRISISKTVMLNYNLYPELPAIEADASQMRQVIMNLITNASEAIGDKSGVITITTGVMECEAQYLAETFLDDGLKQGIYVYLEVTDTGCGMDEEAQSKIFDPFYTTKFTGRGLGLAAVLGIVRGHKGAIKVYSKRGEGTTFKILLPCSDKKAAKAAGEALNIQSLHGEGKVG